MPKLLSGRQLLSAPSQLTDRRFTFLDLREAQPNLGLTPTTSTGFTLVADSQGRLVFANSLGNLVVNSGPGQPFRQTLARTGNAGAQPDPRAAPVD